MLQSSTVIAVSFNVPLLSLTNHNTSANAAYNAFNFSANFGPTSWVSQSGATIPVDTNKLDQSLNPVTPGHVSKTDVHTLIPSRPDLRWFAHATPWFGPNNHINIGLNNNTAAYVAAMITDMKNRGFNGVVINWYGKGNQTDNVTLKIKSYLASLPTNNFTYLLMLDKGTAGGLGTSNLEYQIHYCQTNYFTDPNYEHEPVTAGEPILMFFGVRSAVGAANMATIKSDLGGNMVWVEQGTSYLSESWEDESFQWTDNFDTGVNSSDPFNLNKVVSQFTTIKNSGKKAFGAMCSQFNGTLTDSLSWSLGKYLPSSNGVCEVQRAFAINASLPPNMTRMQWATWSDWEEGSQVESGIENNVAVTAQMNTNLLSWTIDSGDEKTIDHYEIYAASNGVNAAFLGNLANGVHKTNLTQVGLAPGNYQFYVDAIGKPCIRDHLSQPTAAFLSTAPSIIEQPTNTTVAFGASATFTISAAGSSPFTYTWYDQDNIIVGSNSVLEITNATQNNSFYVAVTNQFGGITSSVATLTILTGPVMLSDLRPQFQKIWQGDSVTLTVAAGGQPPLHYQWTQNSQNIPGATNASFSFAALAGTNVYQVNVSNDEGNTNSTIATVVGLPATFLNPANYNHLRITFSGYTNNETLIEFPALIRLGTNIPGFNYAQFISPANGADLRIISANGRELPSQIDQWNPSGESEIWVQVPSIRSSNDYITACWGNPSDNSLLPSNTNGAVWTTVSGSNNFLAVYHLSEGGVPFADSTLQHSLNSGVAPVSTNGMIGSAAAFNGTSQFLDAGVVNVGKTFTLSAWVNIAPTAKSEQTIWGNKQGGWNTAGFDFYVNSWQTNDGKIYFDTADGVNGNVSSRTVSHAVTFGEWHLLTGTMDGVNGVVHVFVDGVDQTINTGVDTAFQTTNYLRSGSLLTGSPGATGSSGSYFNGLMDDSRIENGVRSAAWIWASWATVADGSFSAYGTITPAAPPLQYHTDVGQLVLTWSSGTLQSAPDIAGPYTDVPNATSPFGVVPTGQQQFFRVRIPTGGP